MSPEQLRSAKDVDPRSDVWAMGVTLYQALTGKRPFVAQNVGALILCIVETVPPAPHILRPEIPAMLGDAVMRCLQRKPSDRFQNMFELAMALAPFAPPRCHALYDRIAANCEPHALAYSGFTAHGSEYPRDFIIESINEINSCDPCPVFIHSCTNMRAWRSVAM